MGYLAKYVYALMVMVTVKLTSIYSELQWQVADLGPEVSGDKTVPAPEIDPGARTDKEKMSEDTN